MKVYFERKILGGFFLALGILTILGIYSYQTSKDSMRAGKLIADANEILYHIEQLRSSHLQIEAELMRYSINADTAFVRFFTHKIQEAAVHYVTLREMTKDNRTQQVHLDSIQLLGRQKVDLIKMVIRVQQHSIDSVRKLIPSPSNRKLTKGLNSVVEALQLEEKRMLNEHMVENQREVENFYTTFITLVIVAALIVIVLFLTINSNLRARLSAEQALQSAAAEISDLYNSAPCGYHSLDENGTIIEMNDTWLNWMGRKREEVINKLKFADILTPKSKDVFERNFYVFKTQGFTTGIEYEVIRRNRETLLVISNAVALKDSEGNFKQSRATVFDITERHKAEQKVNEANKELEAFTYSVSHDLRAPLRSIDGYSKILQEDYVSQMDPEATRLIDIVRRNARRMGQLIDDLLDFSRLGRKELALNTIHMNSLVDNIKQELLVLEKGREVEFTIHPLVDVAADFSMIRQVWINVILNALKYSNKRLDSKIEVGCQDEPNRVVYYIRDNGVGFDMQYSNKLFGVFQRLHKLEEFEGTGVGLALAHRIISRHGGKIWAESTVNEGATFFFFLPKINLN
jgi:PAS domain S-box-containing protein